jgi:hypothetical protein
VPRWSALAVVEGTILGGRLSLVVQSAVVPNPSDALAGLVVDERVETLPDAIETPGMAFH